MLAQSRSAGFGATGITWYQYFVTECRAIFIHLRLLVFPAGQNLDWDFRASRNILDRGAILSSYGFLVCVLLLLPSRSWTA